MHNLGGGQMPLDPPSTPLGVGVRQKMAIGKMSRCPFKPLTIILFLPFHWSAIPSDFCTPSYRPLYTCNQYLIEGGALNHKDSNDYCLNNAGSSVQIFNGTAPYDLGRKNKIMKLGSTLLHFLKKKTFLEFSFFVWLNV